MHSFPVLDSRIGCSIFSFQVLCLVLNLATMGHAQMVGGQWQDRHRMSGPSVGSWFGTALAGAADVNGDGIFDFAVGAPQHSPGGLLAAGSVFVYSGLDGSLIWHLAGPFEDIGMGWDVDLADFNGDGFADILTGAPGPTGGAGAAYVWSGQSGALLYTVTSAGSRFFGESVDAVGDLNGDGTPDFLIGASDTFLGGLSYAGIAEAYSGSDGSLIYRWEGNNAFDNFGDSVSGLGDLNGDGIEDIGIGIPGYDAVIDREGAVALYDGASGNPIVAFYVAYGPFQQFGASLSGAGDVNADGTPDILVGANVASAVSSFDYAGRAYVLDGSNLNVLYDAVGDPGDWLGDAVGPAGDVNGDGFADFLFGAYQSIHSGTSDGNGYIDLYSGFDGSLIQHFEGDASEDHLHEIGYAGDINGDGEPDLLLGAENFGDLEYVRVVGLDAFLYLSSDQLSSSSGTPVLADLDFPDSEAGSAYAVLLSATGTGPVTVNGLQIPLTADNLLNRMLSGWAPFLLSGSPGSLDAFGDGAAVFHSDPVLAAYLGRKFFVAAVSFDAGSQSGRLSSISREIEIIP